MEQTKFNEILENILIPIIDETAETIDKPIGYEIRDELKKIIEKEKETICQDYNSAKNKFKEDFMHGGKDNSWIDRHKVAALFYINFVDAVKNNYKTDKFNDLLIDLFVHNVAFNAAIAIIESFICADETNPLEYRSYVRGKGIIDQIDRYRDYTIKEFIFACREDKLSVFLLANIFYCIERNSRTECEIIKNKAKSE